MTAEVFAPVGQILDILRSGNPERFLGTSPPGPWDPVPAEVTRPELRRLFLVFLALGPNRTPERLAQVLKASFPDLLKCQRQIWNYQRDLSWRARADAWDVAQNDAVLPQIWDHQTATMLQTSVQHAADARLLQEIARDDLQQLRDWKQKCRSTKRDERPPQPATYFPAHVVHNALQLAQNMERKALGMDIRDMVLRGQLVPVRQRDEIIALVNEAIAQMPDAQQTAFREMANKRLISLEGIK